MPATVSTAPTMAPMRPHQPDPGSGFIATELYYPGSGDIATELYGAPMKAAAGGNSRRRD